MHVHEHNLGKLEIEPVVDLLHALVARGHQALEREAQVVVGQLEAVYPYGDHVLVYAGYKGVVRFGDGVQERLLDLSVLFFSRGERKFFFFFF